MYTILFRQYITPLTPNHGVQSRGQVLFFAFLIRTPTFNTGFELTPPFELTEEQMIFEESFREDV